METFQDSLFRRIASGWISVIFELGRIWRYKGESDFLQQIIAVCSFSPKIQDLKKKFFSCYRWICFANKQKNIRFCLFKSRSQTSTEFQFFLKNPWKRRFVTWNSWNLIVGNPERAVTFKMKQGVMFLIHKPDINSLLLTNWSYQSISRIGLPTISHNIFCKEYTYYTTLDQSGSISGSSGWCWCYRRQCFITLLDF